MKLFNNKKAMEMWQLVMLIMALLLLFALLAWYGASGQNLEVLFTKMGEVFSWIGNYLAEQNRRGIHDNV